MMHRVLPLMCALAIVACSRPQPTAEETAPAPTPVVTPHPASGAKEAAVKKYPDLAIKDSTFNKTFRDLYEEQLQKNPSSLARPEWPLDLAYRTATLLGVHTYGPPPAAPPPPVPATPVVLAAPTPSALDRGAYNKTDHWGHYWVDKNGIRHRYNP